MLKQVLAAGVLLVGVSAVPAIGQCGEWDGQLSRGGNFTIGNVSDSVVWDADAGGPQLPRLVAVGTFTIDVPGEPPFSYLAQWDGARWRSLGSFNAFVSCVTLWDPDDNGPLNYQLVVGGQFTHVNGVQVNHVARFDGTNWHAFGNGISSSFADVVRSLVQWDPDGNGPGGSRLYAGGSFPAAGGVTVNNIAQWDGASWLPLTAASGTGTNDAVYTMTAYDFDGNGPSTDGLIIGGPFTSVGGIATNHLGRWNGTLWQAVLGPPAGDGYVNCLRSWDPDGAGVAPAQLVVAGVSLPAPGNLVTYVSRWDLSAWRPMALPSPTARAQSIYSWDPVGGFPTSPKLVIGCEQAAVIPAIPLVLEWSGTALVPIGGGLADVGSVNSVCALDPDGSGPQSSELVALGAFPGAGIEVAARWDGVSWRAFSNGPDGPVYSLREWDPDGGGPLLPRLVAGGAFGRVGDTAANRVAQWDGEQWSPMASGFNADVLCMTTVDPDGTGPLERELIAAGNMTLSGATAIARVARWNGSSWQPQGSGVMDTVLAMTEFDPDSTGPIPERLTIGGEFVGVAGGGNRVVRWNGTAWQALASGVSKPVTSLASWDRDGAGPLAGELIAGGEFNAAFEFDDYVRRWNGAAWEEYASGLDGDVLALATWDPDGNGPLNAQLIAGGEFSFAGATSANGVARWDGSSWHALGSGLSSGAVVYALETLDVDGPGGDGEVLVVGGLFTSAGGVSANNIARWNGSAWQAMGAGTDGAVRALGTWDRDGLGPGLPELAMGGDFSMVDGDLHRHVALWATRPPELQLQPADVSVEVGQSAGMSVLSDSTSLTYQWRRNGVDLVNGPTPNGSVIVNATNYAVLVQNAQVADSGEYDCVVTRACGSVTSETGTLTVTPPKECPGDANGDNSVNGADLSVLLGQFGQGVTPGTGADFNGDGVVNGADLSVLLGRFGTSC